MPRPEVAEERQVLRQRLLHVDGVEVDDAAQILKAEPAVAGRLALEHARRRYVVDDEREHADADPAIAAGQPGDRATGATLRRGCVRRFWHDTGPRRRAR